MSRTLPSRRNPLVSADSDSTPSYDELLERRRLGRTRLSVKKGLIGTTNATKEENLGPVEYAHLRAPLPDDLSTSEIFAPQEGQPHPQTYFLMRRSKDGYVSATGMFKIAFPWAKSAEEKAEREHLKALDVTSQDDIAGNVWVSPEYALELASDYGLEHWIRALLDPADIQSSPTSAKKGISEPPKFQLPATMKDIRLSPPATTGKRSRNARASSPSKSTPARAKASPRKRQTKKEKEANAAYATAASASLQSALEDAASIAEGTPAPEESEEPESSLAASPKIDGELAPASPSSDKVRVEVDQEVEVNGDTEVTHTNVTVEMPAGLPELPLPQDTESMLAQAKEMVEKAKQLESSPKITRKRKVEEVEPSDLDAELPVQPAKRARLLEEKLKREKVRTRAVFGVAASLAVAAAIPFFQTFF